MGKAEKERTSRRKVLKGLVELRNDHKFASVLIWVNNLGTSLFGTDGLKEKAKSAFNCSVFVLVMQETLLCGRMSWRGMN